MSLRADPAVTFEDALLIAYFRNVCTAGFSQFNGEISDDEQRAFWERTEGKRRAWLYFDDEGVPVGFGMLLLQDDGLWTTTVAVHPNHAGLGYGKAITHDIVTMAPGPCRAQARKDNPAAVKLHVADDWDIVDGPNPALVYFRSKVGVTA
jgi:GNAT superfamily N-acetyltransferase